MRSAPRLSGLVGAPGSEARRRLGAPDAERPARPGRWLVWEGAGWRLRLRTGGGPSGKGEGSGTPGDEDRITSWTVTWGEGRGTLREAVEPLGLWPAAKPNVRADALEVPAARRGLAGPDGRPDRSLTATVQAGRFVRVAVFDEAPEW